MPFFKDSAISNSNCACFSLSFSFSLAFFSFSFVGSSSGSSFGFNSSGGILFILKLFAASKCFWKRRSFDLLPLEDDVVAFSLYKKAKNALNIQLVSFNPFFRRIRFIKLIAFCVCPFKNNNPQKIILRLRSSISGSIVIAFVIANSTSLISSSFFARFK